MKKLLVVATLVSLPLTALGGEFGKKKKPTPASKMSRKKRNKMLTPKRKKTPQYSVNIETLNPKTPIYKRKITRESIATAITHGNDQALTPPKWQNDVDKERKKELYAKQCVIVPAFSPKVKNSPTIAKEVKKPRRRFAKRTQKKRRKRSTSSPTSPTRKIDWSKITLTRGSGS